MIIGLFGFILTVGIYWIAKWFYRLKPHPLLSPLLITPAVVIILLVMTHIPYESYNISAQWLSDLLQPATIAFAVPLYKHYQLLKKHAAEILISVCSGSAVAVASSAWIGGSLHMNKELIYSLIPRSVTTPIAMNVSEMIGGVPTITAAFALITGLLGTIIGPLVIRIFRIHNDIARGVLMGTSAHGAGTSKAFEFSSVSGTVSSVSMILSAIITLFAAPTVISVILSIA